MEDMAVAGDTFDFADENELKTEIAKRLSTVEHIKDSQETVEKIPGDKRSAFGYPFTGASILYGPRVNYAAREYWVPTVPDNYAVRTDKVKNKELLSKPRHERCDCLSFCRAAAAQAHAYPLRLSHLARKFYVAG